MKKIFSSLFISAILAVGFSSCLGGDNGSSYTEGSDFGVVKIVDNSLKTAILTNGLVITGDQINNYNPGDAFIVSYKVDFSNWVNNVALKVDYATIDDKNVYLNADQKKVIGLNDGETVVETTPTANNVFLAIGSPIGVKYEYLENRWLMSFSAMVKSDQNISLQLYYDKNNQKQGDKDLPENVVVLDAVLVKSVSDLATQELVKKTGSVVANLTSLRAKDLKEMQSKATESNVATAANTTVVWLRYPKLNSSNEPSYEYLKEAFAITYLKKTTAN